MSSRTTGAIAFLLLVAALAVVDWSLRRWGSLAINQRPRPGGRITVLFLGICASCALLEVLASFLRSSAPAAAVFVALLQVPAAVFVALALDRALPSPRPANGQAPQE